MDKDPFITGGENQNGAGYNIGMLLTQINKNCYTKYQDAGFREDNRGHIVTENGTPKYQQE